MSYDQLTRAATRSKISGAERMRDAQYLRTQAELCLELARQMSDRHTVENLKAEAARYQAEAADIESAEQPESKDWL
jgi:predicted NAD/FAD-dependent oxidoreductase